MDLETVPVNMNNSRTESSYGVAGRGNKRLVLLVGTRGALENIEKETTQQGQNVELNEINIRA